MTDESIGSRLAIRDDHHCFGCGATNPWGLHLTFFSDPDGSVWSRWTPSINHQGYEGIVHGGIVTTVLDEVMGWVVSNAGIWAVTGRLNVAFRKPVEIGVATIARAWIVSNDRRKLDVAASITRESDGQLLADATGIFVRVPHETAEAWQRRYFDPD
jgi:acyl-coenzyme A thioesterase PaaI-like protein